MDVFVELKAIISEFQAKMAEARGEMEETRKSSESNFSSLGKTAGLGLAAVAGAAIGVGAAAIEMGNKLEDAHATLVQAVKDTGGSMAQLGAPLDAVDKKMEAFGFTNADTENALAQMTIGLKSSTKAMSLISLAADIARAKHISLAAAGLLVVKAEEGQTTALRRAGIDLPIVASGALKVQQAQTALAAAQQALNAILLASPNAVDANSKAHARYETALQKVQTDQQKLSALQLSGTQIIAALSQRYGGQAAAAADTFSGRMEVMRARIEDVGAKIGEKLIPILEKLMTVVANVIGWLDKHRTVALALAIAVGVVLVAAAVAWVASLSPIILTVGAVVLALGAFVAIGKLLMDNWDTILRFLRSGFGTLAQVIVLGPFAAITLLALHWKEVWGTITGITRDAVAAIGWIVGTIQSIFYGIGQGVINVFEGIGKGIADAVIYGINWILYAWNQVASALTFKIPGWVPVIGGDSFGLPTASYVQYLAGGGIVTAPTLAMIGEAGPEAVIPLGQLGGGSTAIGGRTSGGGDLVIQIDSVTAGRVLGPALRRWLLEHPGRNATRGRLQT